MRGGIRKGAGAPKKNPRLKKETVSFRLSTWVAEWLRAQPGSKGVLVEEMIIRQNKLKPPEVG